MPPRKSNVSQISEDGAGQSREGLGVEDLALPRTMVQRLAKGVLPPNTQIQKDALLAISKSATVFVNYLSHHANEQAQRLNKKTIQPKDVLDAIHDVEFDAFLPRLEAELKKYNDVQCDKRNSYRKKVRDEQKAKLDASSQGAEGSQDASAGAGVAAAGAAAAGAAVGAAAGAVSSTNGVPVITSPSGVKRDGDGEPSAKKVRGEDGMEVDEDEDEDVPDEAEQDDEQEDEEEDEDEDEEETFEDAKEELAEDLLEERETRDEDMDEALDDGQESD